MDSLVRHLQVCLLFGGIGVGLLVLFAACAAGRRCGAPEQRQSHDHATEGDRAEGVVRDRLGGATLPTHPAASSRTSHSEAAP